MSTLAANAALGLLLAVGMQVRPKLLPLAPVIALLPDLDHLDMLWGVPGLHTRMTFHNVFFIVALPLTIYLVLSAVEAREDWQELAGKAPVILSGSVVLDLLSIEPRGGTGVGGEVALFYPLDDRWWMVARREAASLDPTAWGTVSATLLFLSLLAVATWAWFKYLDGPGTPPTTRSRRRRMGAYVLAWLALFPLLAGVGLLVPADIPPGPVDRSAQSRAHYRQAFSGELAHLPWEVAGLWPGDTFRGLLEATGSFPVGLDSLTLDVGLAPG